MHRSERTEENGTSNPPYPPVNEKYPVDSGKSKEKEEESLKTQKALGLSPIHQTQRKNPKHLAGLALGWAIWQL